MEKQGMVGRKRFRRAGLLIFLLPLFFRAGILRAQEGGGESPAAVEGQAPAEEAAGGGAAVEGEAPVEEAVEQLEIRLETSSASPMVNSPWAIYILVNHPRPSEVNVKPPRFPSALVLERVRTETRLIRPAAPADADAAPPQSERWTRVEFLFTPQRTGALTVDPFEVTVQERLASTKELNVRFREEPRRTRRYEPRFRWVAPPPVPSGKPAEFLLELLDWDPEKEAPQGLFRGRAPENAILEESLPVSASGGIYRYAFRVIPLEETNVVLESRSFQAEGFTLNVPELAIAVSPAREAPAADSPDLPQNPPPSEIPAPETGSEEAAPEDGKPPLRPFPMYREKVFPPLQAEYGRIAANARALWEGGRRAEALAELRRNERDSLCGPLLSPLRRELEQSLGLGFVKDESWRPLKIPLPVWALFGALLLSAAIALFALRARPKRRNADSPPYGPPNGDPPGDVPEPDVTFRRRGGFKTIIAVVLSIGVALIFIDQGMGYFFMGNFLIERMERSAVLESTPAYRVPDLKGAVNARFVEGQPVTVGDFKGDWHYAESPDGRSGWVPREAVIKY